MATRAPKRTLGEEGEEFTGEKKSKIEDPDSHEVRCLIPTSQVGSIIGKKGCNIARIREECSVYVSILPSAEGVRERVMTVKGRSESIALALHRIGEIVMESQEQRLAKRGENTEDNKDASQFQVRFLLHSSLVGGIIGKGGSLVQATQSSTNARVQVSTVALPQSSEKTVTVSGALDAVYAANQIVIEQMKENSLRPGVKNAAYVPSPYHSASSGGHPPSPYSMPSSNYAPSFPHQGYGHPPYQGYAPQPYHNAPPSNQNFGGQNNYGGQAQSQGLSKQQIVIPTVCAGNVIGKGGSIISNIKSQSGTFISIAAAESSTPHERLVTINGSPQGIQTAVYLIQQIVEQFEGPLTTAPQSY